MKPMIARALGALTASLLLMACSSPSPGGKGSASTADGTGNGGSGSGTTSGAGGGGSFDPALVGSWWAGRGGTSFPYDSQTGEWGTPNGGGLGFIFRADGSFTKAVLDYTSTGSCTTGYSAFEDGTVTSDGGTLVLHKASGHIEFNSTCVPSADSDKPLTVTDETLTYVIAPYSQDASMTGMTVTGQDGASSELRKIQ
jgi:hypothetical protein